MDTCLIIGKEEVTGSILVKGSSFLWRSMGGCPSFHDFCAANGRVMVRFV